MRLKVLKWPAAVCFVAAIATELAGSIYVRQHDARLQLEIAAERQRAAGYRRPVAFGDAVDENAAVWYRRVFTKMEKADAGTLHALYDASSAGPDGDATARHALLTGACRSVDVSALRVALRCAHCDWQLPYGVIEASTDDFSTRPLVAAQCMILEGHQLAALGDAQAAIRSYLQTIALGCDLGVGGLVMNAQAAVITKSGLAALARAVAGAHTAAVLDGLSRQLAQFEACLPTADVGARFERIRLLAAVSRIERTISWALAAQRLADAERFLTEIVEHDRVSGGPDGYELQEQTERREASARSSVVRTGQPDRWILFMMSAEVVRQAYGALQIAIDLEKRRIAIGGYPRDAAAFQSRLNSYALSYRRTKDGYQLVGPRNHEAQAIILEQPMRKASG